MNVITKLFMKVQKSTLGSYIDIENTWIFEFELSELHRVENYAKLHNKAGNTNKCIQYSQKSMN